MNKYAIIISFAFYCILSTSFLYSQKQVISENDTSEVELIQKFKTDEEFYYYVQSLSLPQFKHFAKLIYQSYDRDPLAFYKMLKINHNTVVGSAYFSRVFNEMVKKDLSKLDYLLLTIPSIVKAQIMDIKKNQEMIEAGKPLHIVGYLPRIDIKAVVSEVIKGNGFFSVKDTIIFYYMPFWRQTNYDFKIGETCLVPLDPFINEKDSLSIGLVLILENNPGDIEGTEDLRSYGRYPIIDGKIFDRENYFGYGNYMEWSKFNELLQKEIKEIQSW